MNQELLLKKLKEVIIEQAKENGLPEGIASLEEFEKNLDLLNADSLAGGIESREWVMKHNRTSLHQAAFFGQYNSTNLILSEIKYTNLNISPKDDFGMTPLDYAEQQGHKELAELLKKHGAKKAEEL